MTAMEEATAPASDAGVSPPILAGSGISVNFGGIQALSEVDISIPSGSLVGLIGPNGAGKSTLLACLSGLLRPRKGKVFLDGVDVTARPAHKRAKLGLARTFQMPELFAGLSVREHLTLAYRVHHEHERLWRDLLDGRSWRSPSTAESDRVEQLIDWLELAKFASSAVAALPLGYSRLVEVGRALAASPRVVLLDEPLSGLDGAESQALADTLHGLVGREHVSFLLIDHDVDTVLTRSHDVFVLEFGRMIAHGSPAEIRDNELVRAAYLGDSVVLEASDDSR